MQSVAFLGPGLGQSADAPGNGLQGQPFGAWRLPGSELHPFDVFKQDSGVESVGFGAVLQGSGKILRGSRRDEHDLDSRSLGQCQGRCQAVGSTRFQTDSDSLLGSNEPFAELPMP